MGSRGRPHKYKSWIEALVDDQAYSDATLFNNGMAMGLVPEAVAADPKAVKALSQRVRHAMGRWRVNHGMGPGDVKIHMVGQRPYDAWLGKTWKATLKAST